MSVYRQAASPYVVELNSVIARILITLFTHLQVKKSIFPLKELLNDKIMFKLFHFISNVLASASSKFGEKKIDLFQVDAEVFALADRSNSLSRNVFL